MGNLPRNQERFWKEAWITPCPRKDNNNLSDVGAQDAFRLRRGLSDFDACNDFLFCVLERGPVTVCGSLNRTVRRLMGASLSYTLIHKSSTPSTQICPNDIVIFRFVYLYPGRAIRLKFDNITRVLRVAPDPETQSLPDDLNPSCAVTTLIW